MLVDVGRSVLRLSVVRPVVTSYKAEKQLDRSLHGQVCLQTLELSVQWSYLTRLRNSRIDLFMDKFVYRP